MVLEDFKEIDLKEFPKEFDILLENQKREIEHIIENGIDYDSILKPLQDLESRRDNLFTILDHIHNVNNSEETTKAYLETLPKISKFETKLLQNIELFKKIERLKSNNRERQRVIDNSIKSLKLNGIDLPKEQKMELEKIDLELEELSNQFSQNLIEAQKSYRLLLEEADVAGIEKSDLESRRVEENGKLYYRFTLQIPDYILYMTYGKNREIREEYYKAFVTKAPENKKIIDRILLLRDRKVKILGFNNYADYSIKKRDAKSTKEVIEFLEKLLELTLPHAEKEMEELKEFAKREDNILSLQPFDLAYYSQKLKEQKFQFNENIIKSYFESGEVLNGLLNLVSKLFNMEFIENRDSPTWQGNIKTFDIYRDRELIGRIYFDLESRENKRGGAWMNGWQTHFIDTENRTHLPAVFIVTNFQRATDKTPSLLRHNDIVTLFHEMGHAIHHLFSKCSEYSISGIHGVAWDTVEFPSQFLENFAYEKSILKGFAYHYKTKEAIDESLLDKIKDSKNFQSALGLIRQIELSLFDILLHTRVYQGEEVQELLDSIRQRTSLIDIPKYNKFQNGFSHIFAGGYSAGYYSYKWAEVLSADAFFECLDINGEFNQEKANGYYENILTKGGSDDMSVLYRNWLGRDAKLEALLRLYNLDNKS